MRNLQIIYLNVAFFLFISSVAFSIDINMTKDRDENICMREIIIVDSSICIILDSIINYNQYCKKKKNCSSPYYTIYDITHLSENGGLELGVYSDGYSSMGIKKMRNPSVLIYKNQYFIFDESVYIRKKINFFIQPSQNIINFKIRKTRRTHLGNTYFFSRIIIDDYSFHLSCGHCMCDYGNLHKGSRFFGIRKLVYDIFCPRRSSKRM